jgi:exodeoxyribonuclease VII large subunit
LEEDPILSDAWVRGEVTDFMRSAAGHCYFSLSGAGSKLNCVLFNRNALAVPVLPTPGDEIVAHGRVSVYEVQGRYQLYVDAIAPVGAGALQLQFEALRQRLEAEGLFAIERKRSLPERPRAIGVVTSAQGAVWHDIQNVTRRRYPLVELVLAPSAVQGADAPEQLVAGLEALQLDPQIDVIIIGRGGGSPEELAVFNDEALARAIFRSRVPVVSAVGHETDFTIADFVADLRAPTPSAAAELCVPDRRAIGAELWQRTTGAREIVVDLLDVRQAAWRESAARCQRLQPGNRIDRSRIDLDLRQATARALVTEQLASQYSRLQLLHERGRLLDPRDILRRGYVAVSTDDDGAGHRLRRAGDLDGIDRVRLGFYDGTLRARIVRDSG